MPAARFDQPAPLAQGYVTYGTDSGHQNEPGQPPQTFALNDEALVNFAHASYKKVRDVAVALMQRAYGRAPGEAVLRRQLRRRPRGPDDGAALPGAISTASSAACR